MQSYKEFGALANFRALFLHYFSLTPLFTICSSPPLSSPSARFFSSLLRQLLFSLSSPSARLFPLFLGRHRGEAVSEAEAENLFKHPLLPAFAFTGRRGIVSAVQIHLRRQKAVDGEIERMLPVAGEIVVIAEEIESLPPADVGS